MNFLGTWKIYIYKSGYFKVHEETSCIKIFNFFTQIWNGQTPYLFAQPRLRVMRWWRRQSQFSWQFSLSPLSRGPVSLCQPSRQSGGRTCQHNRSLSWYCFSLSLLLYWKCYQSKTFIKFWWEKLIFYARRLTSSNNLNILCHSQHHSCQHWIKQNIICYSISFLTNVVGNVTYY